MRRRPFQPAVACGSPRFRTSGVADLAPNPPLRDSNGRVAADPNLLTTLTKTNVRDTAGGLLARMGACTCALAYARVRARVCACACARVTLPNPPVIKDQIIQTLFVVGFVLGGR